MPLYLALAVVGLVGLWAASSFAGTQASAASPGGAGSPPAGVPSPPFNLTYPGAGAWQHDAAYIHAYQSALTFLAWKTSTPAWDPGGIDGKYGPHTAAAVSAFQSAKGLTVDGECGASTAAALTAALSTAQGSSAQGSNLELVGQAIAQAGLTMKAKLFPGRGEDHLGAAGACVWYPMSAAPAGLQAAVSVVLWTLAQDPAVTVGRSIHTVNGVPVTFHKEGPVGHGPAGPLYHVVALSYCAG